jgi:alcohol dehydrogenase
VLVRIGAAGLCHSDLFVINGDRPMPMALGQDVDDLDVGDHVVMVFMPSCGHCVPCAEGRPALCEPGRRRTARAHCSPASGGCTVTGLK